MPFEKLSDWSYCNSGAGTYGYSLLDLAGDGKLDGGVNLIMSHDTCADINIGRTHWLVHPHTGSGFADTPLPWALPAPYHTGYADHETIPLPFGIGGEDKHCHGATGSYDYAVADLGGDGNSDLVMLNDTCADQSTGRTHWLVYEGACPP